MCIRTKNTQLSELSVLSRGGFFVCTQQNRYKKLNEVAMNTHFFLLTAKCIHLHSVLASLPNKSSEHYCACCFPLLTT